MSYSIGPLLGKPQALIAALKKQVEGYTGASREEADAALAFVVPQLEKADPNRVTAAGATGSAGGGYVQHSIQVGTLPGMYSIPQLVE